MKRDSKINRIDPITVEVINNALAAIAEEITINLARTAHSTIVYEVQDFCTGLLDAQGRLVGDMFDGAGFVRGVQRKGFNLTGKRVMVVGTGGVGSAIAASLAAEKIAAISLFDVNTASCEGLAQRLVNEYPNIQVKTGSNDPEGHDLVVNATPMGMNEGDPLPMDVSRIAPESFVGEVVMRTEMTAFLQAAQNRGCRVQVGSDMLFEQIPAYLEYFGFKTTTAEVLRSVARLG